MRSAKDILIERTTCEDVVSIVEAEAEYLEQLQDTEDMEEEAHDPYDCPADRHGEYCEACAAFWIDERNDHLTRKGE